MSVLVIHISVLIASIGRINTGPGGNHDVGAIYTPKIAAKRSIDATE